MFPSPDKPVRNTVLRGQELGVGIHKPPVPFLALSPAAQPVHKILYITLMDHILHVVRGTAQAVKAVILLVLVKQIVSRHQILALITLFRLGEIIILSVFIQPLFLLLAVRQPAQKELLAQLFRKFSIVYPRLNLDNTIIFES